jgi:peroxiredoxin
MSESIPPPPPPEETPPPPPAEEAAAPKRCGKAFSSLVLGLFGCLLGGAALAGFLLMDKAPADSVTINGNLDQMQNVVVEDAKQRGLKMFFASFGQWFGFAGAALGLTGLIAGITHLYHAHIKLVIPKRGLAAVGSFFSLIATLSIGLALWHGYQTHVGLPTENANEAFNRVDQLAGIMKKGEDIANGDGSGGLDEKTRGLAENLLGSTLDPITQLMTEDYLNRRAPNVELYTSLGGSYSIENARNTRVLVMVFSSASPACKRAVAPLNALRAEVARGELLILAVSNEKPAPVEAFMKSTGAKFPVGNASFMPEPYSAALSKPAYFVIDRQGFMESIKTGVQSLDQLRRLARKKP